MATGAPGLDKFRIALWTPPEVGWTVTGKATNVLSGRAMLEALLNVPSLTTHLRLDRRAGPGPEVRAKYIVRTADVPEDKRADLK